MNHNRPFVGTMGTGPSLYEVLNLSKCMLNETIICVIIYLISVYLIYAYCKHLFDEHKKNMLIKYKNLDDYTGIERTTSVPFLEYIAPILWIFIIIFVIAFVIFDPKQLFYVNYDSSVIFVILLAGSIILAVLPFIIPIALALLFFSLFLIVDIFNSHETIVSDNFLKFVDNEIIKSDTIHKKYPDFIAYFFHEIVSVTNLLKYLPLFILLIIGILVVPNIFHIYENARVYKQIIGEFTIIIVLFIIIIIQPILLLGTIIENKISNTPKMLSVFRLAGDTIDIMALALVGAFILLAVLVWHGYEMALAEPISKYIKTIFVIVSFSISYFVIFSIMAITKGAIFIRKIITIPISLMIYLLSFLSIIVLDIII